MRLLMNLPAECLLLIANQLSEIRDLNAFAQTTRTLHALLNTHVYRREVKSRGAEGLWRAISLPNLEAVRHFIRAGADVNESDEEHAGSAALCKALESRSELMARWNNRGARGSNAPDQRTYQDRMRIFRAIIEFLLDSGADVNNRGSGGERPLHRAAWLGDQEGMIELLVQRGADVAAVSARGRTALHNAAFEGTVGNLKSLLEAGADVNAGVGGMKGTPLHEAARMGRPEAVAFLLDNGAEVDARNERGETPLLTVVSFMWCRLLPDVVQQLVDAGADINAVDRRGMTLLHRAALDGDRQEIIDCLLANGARTDLEDADGRTYDEVRY
ncbi:ankyrin repeat-containing domain protein [Aspergillus karnatakaensis]|uniref:ankyrin repeat-containing domain protein n=1 Tax=Aspergillus karnatakaensis TaxID=1810916 RepID=UPI003CCD5FD1